MRFFIQQKENLTLWVVVTAFQCCLVKKHSAYHFFVKIPEYLNVSSIMKTIYLARHAKSSWDSGAESDFDRPLNDRGESDAIKLGKELKIQNWIPEKIIASPAIRAKQTCKSFCEGMEYPFDHVEWNRDIYSAYMVTLLHMLAALDEKVSSVMLLGHNPAMEDLLVHLCGYASAAEYQLKNDKLFTTANVAKIETSVDWKDLIMDEANLISILRPKEI